MESDPVKPQHNILGRLEFIMGQHGIERDPTAIAYSVIQSAIQSTIHYGRTFLQLAAGQCAYPVPSFTQHVSAAAMRRECWVRRIRLG
jgi:hypothetical protein